MNRNSVRQLDKSARYLSLTSFIFFTAISRKASCGILALFVYHFFRFHRALWGDKILSQRFHYLTYQIKIKTIINYWGLNKFLRFYLVFKRLFFSKILFMRKRYFSFFGHSYPLTCCFTIRSRIEWIEALEAWRIDKQRQRNTKSVFDFTPRLYRKCGWNLCSSNPSLVKSFFYISSFENQSSRFILFTFAPSFYFNKHIFFPYVFAIYFKSA